MRRAVLLAQPLCEGATRLLFKRQKLYTHASRLISLRKSADPHHSGRRMDGACSGHLKLDGQRFPLLQEQLGFEEGPTQGEILTHECENACSTHVAGGKTGFYGDSGLFSLISTHRYSH